MKSIIEIQFDSSLFYGENKAERELRVIIKNPPYFPKEGDIFGCKWDDYISDRTILKKLEEFEEDDVWVVSHYFIDYSKRVCKYTVVLIDALSYETSQKKKSQL